jgi:3-methyladenine DNA glycosylase AlkC
VSKRPAAHSTHPAERFSAPAAIQRGSPLKQLMGRQAVDLLAESMAAVAPDFDAARFKRRALRGLEALEFKPRAEHIARALAEQLPEDFAEAAKILIASLGPELIKTEGNGLATFFYLPHSQVIAHRGASSLESGLRACYELTKRFTAEFCIRPLLAAHQEASLKRLAVWTADPNPHVRRLVSEGTRPRLPWAMRLRAFQEDPLPTLALLEKLKDDPERYVRRSVANHLGDILKDNPAPAFATCERWIEEALTDRLVPAQAKNRLWIVRHALRLPAKKGEPQAVQLRDRARKAPVKERTKP